MIQGKCPDCKKMWIHDPEKGYESDQAKAVWPQYEEGRILIECCPQCCIDNHDGEYFGSIAKMLPKRRRQESRHIDPAKF